MEELTEEELGIILDWWKVVKDWVKPYPIHDSHYNLKYKISAEYRHRKFEVKKCRK